MRVRGGVRGGEGREEEKEEKHTSYDLAMHTHHSHQNITTHIVLCL